MFSCCACICEWWSFAFRARTEVGAYAADNRATVSDVVAQATNEQQLMTSVANIKSVWGKFEFKLLPYREYKDIFYLTEIDEVMQQLEENQVSFFFRGAAL
jgi:hypothetical protein